jgi:hypothetical protein
MMPDSIGAVRQTRGFLTIFIDSGQVTVLGIRPHFSISLFSKPPSASLPVSRRQAWLADQVLKYAASCSTVYCAVIENAGHAISGLIHVLPENADQRPVARHCFQQCC